MKPKSANPTFEDQSSHCASRALFSAFLATAFILQGVLVPVNAESRLSGLESSESRPLGLDEQAPIGSSRALHTRREQNDSAGNSYIERQLNGALQAAGEQLSGVFSNKQQFSSVLDGIKDGEVDLQERLLLAGQERAQSMVDVGLKRLEERLEGRVLRNLELSYRAPFAGREDLFHANATLALWERSEQLLFGQGGLVIRDEKEGANIGLGYRFMAQQDLLLGVNAFYDYLSDPDVGRWSVGAEARSSWLDLYANWYQGTGDDREGDTLYYSPDGWDIEVAAHLPDTPWIEAAASYYTWDGERGQDDLEGQRYRLSFKPSTLVGIGFEYDSPDEGDGSWGVEFDLNYQFGVPLSEQLNFSGNQGKLDLWSRRYEKVEREYAIRVREQRTAPAAVPISTLGFAELQAVATVQVPLPDGQYLNTATADDFRVTENLPGDISQTNFISSPPTLDLTYTGTTPVGTFSITITAPASTHTGSGDLLVYRARVDEPLVSTAIGPRVGPPSLPAQAPGCSSGGSGAACVVPPSGTMPVMVQVPITPSPAGSCPTCQISLTYTFRFVGTATLDTDYGVTELTLTTTSNPLASPMEITPLPNVSSPSFTVTLTSVTTHYLNVTLSLRGDGDAVAESIELENTGNPAGSGQTLLTLEPAGTPYADLTAATPLDENNLATGATVMVALTNSVYVDSLTAEDNFTLTENVEGDVTFTVVRDSDTEATLTLTHDGTDINADGTLVVTVLDSAHSDSGDLNAGSLPINAAGVIVTPATLSVPEDGSSTEDYTLVLNTAPTADVTIAVASSDTLAATVSSASLTFTPANWNTAQTITVTGVNDNVENTPARTASLTHTAASADGDYDGAAISIASVTVTVTDDDVASAVLAAADPTTLGERRLNSSTDRATVTVTLTNTVYEPSAELTADDFMLTDTVDGEVTVESVNRDSDTEATLTLAHTGAISSDGTVSVTVLDSAHTGSGDLDAGSLPIDATAPTVSSVAFSTTGPYVLGDNIEITITFSEDVFVEGTTPNASVITANFMPRIVAYTSGDGTNTLVFRRTVVAGDDDADGVDIGSSPLLGGGGIIRDAAGNDVGRIGTNNQINGGDDQRIDTTTDTTLPLLSTATVDGITLTLTYNEALGASTPSTGTYTVTAAGNPVDVNSVAISGMTVTLTLATAVTGGDTVTLSYAPGANPVQDTAGNDAAALTNRGVTSTSGTVAVTLNNIAGDDIVNIAEQAAGFTISGTVADGGTVEVTLDGGTPRGTTETGTTWTLDIPGGDTEITNPSVVVVATAMLAGAPGTVSRTINVDLVAPTATYMAPATLTVGTATTTITPDSPSADIVSYVVQSGTLPPGLSLAEGTGFISGTPTTADAATATVTIRLTDTAGNTTDDTTDVEIIFPIVAIGSQTLVGFAYSANTATLGQLAPTVIAPMGAQTPLTYSSSTSAVCTVDAGTGALTLVATGDCDITVTASMTANYNEATADFTITVSAAVPSISIAADTSPVTEGTAATFTLTAAPAPGTDLTVTVTVTETGDFIASAPTTVTITGSETTATLTVMTEDDSMNEANGMITATVETGTGYMVDATNNSASVTVNDDDAGVTVDPTELTVPEDGSSTGTYTLVLDTVPTADVIITVANSNTLAATVSPATLTFTQTNWDTAQTVTVTGVNDNVDNPSDARTASLSHTANSADGNYSGVAITIASVTVTVEDDDAAAAGVTVTPVTLSVPEDGSSTADYTLVLDTAPTADVTIAVASDTDTAATVSSASLTFTPTNWNTAQTVTVTGVNDNVDNPGNARTASLTHVPTSTDTAYNSVSIDSVTVTVEDDDAAAAGVTVTPVTLSVPENGSSTADYTLVLDTAPTADVTIAVASDTVTAATVSSASLTFTPTNWDTAQTVTVTGVNDDVDNPGNARTATVTHVPTSADAGYGSVVIASVTVTVDDDDDAGVTVDPLALTVDEAGSNTTADYTLVLDTMPTADVTIAVASDTDTAATVSSASLTFTPTNWDTAQTVTVTGVNDDDDNVGDQRTATVTHTAASTDGNYEGVAISIASVTVTVEDDDDLVSGTVMVSLDADIAGDDEVNIAEKALGFTISGTVADGATVGVTLAGGSTRTATVSTTTWTLDILADNPEITGTSVVVVATATMGSDTGTVTRTIDVDLVAPTATYTAPGTLTVGMAITDIMPGSPSADISSYALQASTLPPGLTLASDTGVISGTPTTVNATTADVTIRLTDEAGNPGDVPIAFPMVAMGSQVLDGFAYTPDTVALNAPTPPVVTLPSGVQTGSTLSYTSGDINICTVDSAGALTLVTAGACVITVTASATTNYNEATAEFTITVSPPAAGVTVDPTELTVPEDGSSTADYTLVLNTMPTADVTITVANSDTLAATVSSASLTFTTTDWNTAQTVTVTGVNDNTDNPSDVRTASLSHTAASTDSNYEGVAITIASVTVTVDDDDTASTVDTVAISSTGPYVLDEDIEVTVTFSEAVTVDTASGTPQIPLVVGANTRQAVYTSGSTTAALVFTYTVVAGETDADGVSIVENTLSGNGGTIRNSDGTDANLDHLAVAPDTAHAVDTTAPSVSAPFIVGDILSLFYDEDLGRSSTPVAGDYTVTVDGTPVNVTTVAFFSDTSLSLTLATAVTPGQTVTLSYVSGASPLRDLAGNNAADLTDQDVDNLTLGAVLAASTPLTETNLNGATVTVTLQGAEYVASAQLGGDDFELTTDVPGTLTVSDVARTSPTVATLTLAYDNVDISTEGTLSVTVLDSANLSGSGADLISNTVTITPDGPPAAGVTVDPTSVTVPEASGTSTYTVVLDTVPTADVTIAVASDTDTAATVSSASLTFTPTNWDTAQTVTVTGVNDDVPGDRTATVTHASTSTDTTYNSVSIDSVTVTVEDDDAAAAGVTVDPTELTVDEADGTGTYTLVLDTAPTADVTIAVASDTVTAATVSSASLTFTTTDWNTAQTVTVTGVSDTDPGDRTATVTHTATSTDTDYEGVAIDPVTVTVEDDDAAAAGVTVTPTELTVPEDGSATADYTLVLTSAPTADVTIAVESDTDTAATVSSASLTFTTTDWNTAQTVTVTGVSDTDPGDRTATVTHTATSTDTDYEGVAIDPVTVTVEDDDAAAAGVTVDPTELTVDEADGTGTYTLVLDTAPTADVTIAVASDTVTAATVSSASLTFTTTDWNTAQTVTVTGVSDTDPGDRTATVTHTATSTDTDYEGVAIDPVTVTVEDDDAAAAGVTVTPTELTVPEDGSATADYTLVLTSAPTADVTIAVESDTDTAATVSSASLTFTTTDWNTAQTVTVTGVSDTDPGDRTATVTHTATSTDTDYEGVAIDPVTVTVEDDDAAAGVTVTPTELTVPEDGSATADYTLVLTSAPTADVTIAVESDTDTAATVSSASLTFTTTDWNTAQTVTVTGVSDTDPGDRTATVTHTATSTDTDYEGVAIDPVTVTVEDDDAAAAGVTVTPTELTVPEDGSATADYTLVLTSAPTADVTIAVESDTDTAATVSSASLTFTTTDWNTAQTVTVTGVSDTDPGDRTATVTHTATSTDTDYEGVAIDPVTVTVEDDDAAAAGVTVTPTELTVPEDGSATADYTLVLTSAPTADVTIAVESDTDTAATVSSASLTFTTTDWNTAQTVTVTGVSDTDPGDRTATVTHTATSTDTDYEGVAIDPVTVTVEDDDAAAAGVTVTPTELTVPEDGSATADYTLVLTSAPTADVTIAVESDTDTAATVSSASLTFTTTDWNTAQTVTVTGVSDTDPGDRTATVTHTATSTDTDYEGVAIDPVTVTVEDDDDATTGDVTVGLDADIAGDDIVNIDEHTTGFTISGTVETGATVEVTLGGGSTRTVTVMGTTWELDILANDPDITGTTSVDVVATATMGGDTGTVTRTIGVDLVAPSATYAAPGTLTVGMAITAIPPGSPSEIISNYALQSGTIPPGLTLAEDTGVISGAPTTASTTTPTVTIGLTDTAGNPATVEIDFPAVGLGSQTLVGFAYSAGTATIGQTAPTVNAPTGAQTSDGSTLSYASGDTNICTVDAGTGALTLVAAGNCVITVTASATSNYNEATDTLTITVSEAAAVMVTLDAIAGDDIVNIDEHTTGFPIGGTVTDGATVEVTLDGGATTRSATVTVTDWTLDIPANDPDIAGTTSVEVEVTATLSGTTDTVSRTIDVDLVAPSATYAAPGTLTVGMAITDITPGSPSGDIASYAVVSGAIPPGLTLAEDTGDISGAPTTANVATAPVTIGLTDTAGNPATVEIDFPAVDLGSQTLVGFGYSSTMVTLGQPAPTVNAPTGQQTGSMLSYTSGDTNICTVDAGTGALTLVAAGNCVITVTASATSNYNEATDTLTITVSEAAAVMVTLDAIASDDIVNIDEHTTGFPIGGTVTDGATVEVTLDGGAPRGTTETGTTWTLDIPANDGEIAGTSVEVEVTATLSGTTDTMSRTIDVDLVAPSATYAAPGTLTVGMAITDITPGSPSGDIASYAVVSGAIPPGLTLAEDTGDISGAPTTANVATAPVTIGLTDTAGNPATVEIDFPAVDLGSQTLVGFGYSSTMVTLGQPAPTVNAPTGQQTGSMLSYTSGDTNICTVDAGTGALTLVAAGNCVITVTASATSNYNEATDTLTITVSEAAAVMVTLDAIAGDDIVNIDEHTTGFTISGTVTDGATVEVTLGGGAARGTTETGTTWTLDIPANDPDITGTTSVVVEVTATLASVTDTMSRTIDVDLVAPMADYTAPVTLTVGMAITDITPSTSFTDISAYAVQSGTIPPGLMLDEDTGVISGAPTTASTTTPTVTIGLTDTAGNPATVEINFPAVAMGSQTLTGFTYSADTATIGQTAPMVTAPTGAQTSDGSALSYASGDEAICTVDADTGALTLVAAGDCVITVTASATANYNEATANFTIVVSEASAVTVTLDADIATDDIVNIDEHTTGFTISGTVTDGATVEVTLGGGAARGTTETGTTWTLDIPANDPDITGTTSVVVEVTATLASVTDTMSRTIDVDLVAPMADYTAPVTLTVGMAITDITPSTSFTDISAYAVQSGTIPPGLMLDEDTGVISGAPTTASTTTPTVTIGLTDTAGNPATVEINFPAVAMGSQTLTGFTYSADTATIGQTAPMVTAPTGAQTSDGSALSYASGDEAICTVDADTGALTLVAAGNCVITVTASATDNYTLATAEFPIVVSEAVVVTVMVTLDANIATDDIVNIDEHTTGFTISGTVTDGATVEVTLDGGATTRSATVSTTTWTLAIPVNDPQITGTSVEVEATATLADVTDTVSRTINVDLVAPMADYTAPVTLTVGMAITDITPSTSFTDISAYAVQSGTIPPGLMLDEDTGVISGAPTTASTTTPTVTIGLTDTAGNPATVEINFPAVAMGSQTLTGFTYSADTATIGQTAPMVTAPTGAQTSDGSALSYASGDEAICTVDAGTGALTLVAAGNCVITVTASETANYNAATADSTIVVSAAALPSISIAADTSPVDEGTTATFTLTATSAPAGEDLTITVTVTDSGNFIASAAPTMVTIVNGATTATLTVMTDDDSTDEVNGTITATVTAGTGYTVGGANTASVMITDNDDAPVVAPTVSMVVITSTGPYGVGEVIEVTVTFSEAVTVTGTPQIPLIVGSTTRTIPVSSTSTNTLVFTYTVAAGENDAGGVSIDTNTLALNGGTIQSAGGTNADLEHPAVDPDTAHAVDTTAPAVDTVAITSTGPYAFEGVIQVRVTFSEAVTVTGTPEIILDVGGTPQPATYVSGSDSAVLVFTYTVQAGDSDTDGVRIGPSVLTQAAGSIQDSAGNDAVLTHNLVPPVFNQRVDSTMSSDATLASLMILDNSGVMRALDPGFDPAVSDYAITVESAVTAVTVSLMVNDLGASSTVDTLSSGSLITGVDPASISLVSGVVLRVIINVEAQDGSTGTYRVDITRLLSAPVIDLESLSVNGDTLTFSYSQPLDAGSQPSAMDFTVQADGTTVDIDSVLVAGVTVTLTLATAVTPDQMVVTLSYTPGANPLQGGGPDNAPAIRLVPGDAPVSTLTDEMVRNDTSGPAMAPMLTMATVMGAGGGTGPFGQFVLVFGAPLVVGDGDTGAFTIDRIDGVTDPTDAVLQVQVASTADVGTVTVTFRTYVPDVEYRITYTPTATRPLAGQDPDGTLVGSFTTTATSP